MEKFLYVEEKNDDNDSRSAHVTKADIIRGQQCAPLVSSQCQEKAKEVPSILSGILCGELLGGHRSIIAG